MTVTDTQNSLSATAVDEFASVAVAERSGRYRRALPLGAPRPGEQYAFEVDLDACSGCKACVAACHRLNGLDDGEHWRRVGVLEGERADGTLAVQHVTAACHHCVEPACLAGCPTQAYEKDPVTGIVHHLDDQCIGCSYCTFTCPYDVPRLNHRLGIVRKCDLCAGRLAEGEAPACVQACPTAAISVTLVRREDVQRRCDEPLVPGAPPSSLTWPTTRYHSSKAPLVEARAADAAAVLPAHAHPPLVVMLVLTQAAVGMFVASVGLAAVDDGAAAALGAVSPWVTASTAVLALAASIFHLGRPALAWKAVLGLRTSWLSREVLLFGAFACSAGLLAATAWVAGLEHPAIGPLTISTALFGLAGVVASCLVYVVTGRPFWSGPRVFVRFGATTLVTGLAGATTLASVVSSGAERSLAVGLAGALVVVLAIAANDVRLPSRRGGLGDPDAFERSARLLRGPLKHLWARRVASSATALALALLIVAPGSGGGANVVLAALVTGFVLVGELNERWLFFTAESSPRMPGGSR
ncbi:MAG: dimethyl sulfoxide reductase anchor subunit [Acidimicrobiales bacterium]|nr:dimethyl sulfoxide reductase anchor subunit [Acidimicrobiales bacterium]